MTRLTWHDKKKHIQEITQWKWIYITIHEITQSVESAIIFTTRREVSPQSSGWVVYIILDLRQLNTGFIQKSQWFFMGFSRTLELEFLIKLSNFSRTTFNFQGPLYQECDFTDCTQKTIFTVHFNRTLRLELFAPPTSLNFSVHWP